MVEPQIHLRDRCLLLSFEITTYGEKHREFIVLSMRRFAQLKIPNYNNFFILHAFLPHYHSLALCTIATMMAT